MRTVELSDNISCLKQANSAMGKTCQCQGAAYRKAHRIALLKLDFLCKYGGG